MEGSKKGGGTKGPTGKQSYGLPPRDEPGTDICCLIIQTMSNIRSVHVRTLVA